MQKVFLYNTAARQKEEFKPIKENEVGIYSCGPTVYWNQHIGHMYAYVQWEILVRFLRFIGLFDRNPSKVNALVGLPETDSAVKNPDGPGIGTTTIQLSMHAFITR